MADRNATLIDLSHVIEAGMTTFQGLPGPHICDYWNREASAANYDDGLRFQIGQIDMVANTGTYVGIPIGEHLTNLSARSPTTVSASRPSRPRSSSWAPSRSAPGRRSTDRHCA